MRRRAHDHRSRAKRLYSRCIGFHGSNDPDDTEQRCRSRRPGSNSNTSADVHALAFAAQTFDLVIAIGVIPWLHSERAALQEMRRVLKPGGHLLLTADNNARLNRLLDPLSSPLSAPFRFAAKRFMRLCGVCSPKSEFRSKRHYPSELNRLIREYRFMNLKCGTVGFGPFTLFGKTLFADAMGLRLHRSLQTLSMRRGVPPLRWTGSHYLVLATKV